ncbi:MAG: MiaB/RimO family radical SAM methylthiotransferase, partial [Eggerthellaceae bacterium]|nr:MiaB/RimO family radical SAM methylthiotransferase [Eggerthellaceae bacterium]
MYKTFCTYNIGCKVNRVELDDIERLLLSKGLKQTSSDSADLIIVNTCTVTSEAEKKSRKDIRKFSKRNAEALVVATGCSVALNENEFASFGKNVTVVQKANIMTFLDELVDESLNLDPDIDGLCDSRTRKGIKIQDGCNRACTYCIVHVARGPQTSVSVEDVIKQTKALIDEGINEIVLTGIDLGSYEGVYNGQTIRLDGLLLLLIEKFCKTDERFVRFRISSIEPMSITPSLIDTIAHGNGHICSHLHIPLQSGSSKVLKEMARPYRADEYARIIDCIYAAMPHASVSTDIIVGFPGETDGDFKETIEMAKHCRFSKIHVFPYSKRNNTPASIRTDQVPDDIKKTRAKQLRELSDELRFGEYEKRIGSVERV